MTRSSSAAVERATSVSSPRRNTASSIADREVRADEALVAAQQVLVQLLGVLLRRRHHVRLVAQRALAEGQPHRGEVLLLAGQAHVPPPDVSSSRSTASTAGWRPRRSASHSSMCTFDAGERRRRRGARSLRRPYCRREPRPVRCTRRRPSAAAPPDRRTSGAGAPRSSPTCRRARPRRPPRPSPPPAPDRRGCRSTAAA